MKRELNDRLLRSLANKPRPKVLEIWDQTLRGFGARITPRGEISFFVMRRQRGAKGRGPMRLTIGPYSLFSLAQARGQGRDLLRELYTGVDPRQRRADEMAAEAAKRAVLFRAVGEDFIARHVPGKRTGKEIERRIRRELIARWGDRPITEISRRDVIEMVEAIVDRGERESARQTLTYTKRLFGWAISRGTYGLVQAPTTDIRTQDFVGPKQARQRVLTDSELALIWRATEAGYPDGPYVRLLLLLGVRRNELAYATWDEIDLNKGLWSLGGERTKNADPHVIPLPKMAADIFHSLPRHGDRIFSTLSDFNKLKIRVDRRVAELNAGQPVSRWVFHDCRRTLRTGLSTLGVLPHVAELCLGHRQKGITAVYDQHRFERERRDALERWAGHLRRIVDGLPGNVVPIRS